MNTELLGGVALGEADGMVWEALSSAVTGDESGRSYVLGVRNELGQIYRVVRLTGRTALQRFQEAMKKAGLPQEPVEMETARQGFDGIFSRPLTGAQP